MKKIFAIVFFISAMCGFAIAQSRLPEFEKVKKIKLLESTREDVKRILAGYKTVDKDADWFEGKNADIDITYTQGDCSEEDSEEMWNVPEGRVKFIEISLNNSGKLKIENLGFNISNFQKEQELLNVKDQFIYHNKSFGIAFRIDEGEVEEIFLFPSNSYKSLLCDNEAAREFYSNKSWFGNSKLEERKIIYEYTPFVESLTLNTREIIVGCTNPAKNGSCSDSNREISVTTVESNQANDVLTFEYVVSGGKIVGKGKQVIWDLRGVKPGAYTITAGVNDGCGICGATKTDMIVVKECPDCR